MSRHIADMVNPVEYSFDARDVGQLIAGKVKVAPGGSTATMKVVLPGFDGGEMLHGPCRWQPRIEGAGGGAATVKLPVVGDDVLLAFDDNADPWVIAWWPASYGYV